MLYKFSRSTLGDERLRTPCNSQTLHSLLGKGNLKLKEKTPHLSLLCLPGVLMPFQVLTNIMMGSVAAIDALLILLFSKETLLEELAGC